VVADPNATRAAAAERGDPEPSEGVIPQKIAIALGRTGQRIYGAL
jgi:hypothetical protein